jgi:murein DD-endopeptidase MepM/ murein hydrolase activator NlpD
MLRKNRIINAIIGFVALSLLPSFPADIRAAYSYQTTDIASKPALRSQGSSSGKPQTAEDPLVKRRELFERVSALTGIPWHRLAAVDQYERTITKVRPKTRQQLGEYIGVFVAESKWAGELNPDSHDETPASIRWFRGIGKDGDGDGLAKRTSDNDLLFAVANHLMKFGDAEDDFAIGVWQYYHNSRAVQRIREFSRLYAEFGTLDLFEHAFPLPVTSDYSYRSTWGTSRSWGGYRIHEGTDIFANYGVPVRSTCYGIVEIKGWNPYGGWRIGIRDLNNVYHYYAHLSGFNKNIAIGSIVKPADVIGWVGSSGYGKPGTQGKFPPHLHYGLYRDQGLVEWSFDPYPLLRKWENDDLRKLRKKT